MATAFVRNRVKFSNQHANRRTELSVMKKTMYSTMTMLITTSLFHNVVSVMNMCSQTFRHVTRDDHEALHRIDDYLRAVPCRGTAACYLRWSTYDPSKTCGHPTCNADFTFFEMGKATTKLGSHVGKPQMLQALSYPGCVMHLCSC